MNEQVTMTADERQEFEQFKAEKAKKEAQQQAKENRETYRLLVDETIEFSVPLLQSASEVLGRTKSNVIANFQSALDLKAEMLKTKEEQRSHTFTHSDGSTRIIIGQHVTDAYLDTVNDGILMVKQFIGSLAKDDESKLLVNGVMKLLAKDNEGNLKASRVLQLRRMAEESGNDRFMEGVKIIEESYRPNVSKTFIRLDVRGTNNEWKPVPLGMTEA